MATLPAGDPEPLFDIAPQRKPRPPAPAPVDDVVKAILAGLQVNEALAEQRAAVVRAIVLEARAHKGTVDPNRVRTRLAGTNGRPALGTPQVVGAVYYALKQLGVLRFVDWVPNTDRGSGNSGKPLPLYHLDRIPEIPAR